MRRAARPVWSKSAASFFLDSVSTGSGPSLKYGGADVVAGQFGSGWTPIGTEQTATGYEVAWKNAAGQYSIWATDSNGNFISTTQAMSGTSSTIENAETSFHQDLNGDGVIGVPGSQTSAGTLTSGLNNTPDFAKISGASIHNNSHIVTDSSSIANSLMSDILKFVNVSPNDEHNTPMSVENVWHDGSKISLGSTDVLDHHAIEAAVHSLNVAINNPYPHEHQG